MVSVVFVADVSRGVGGMVGTPICVQKRSVTGGPRLVLVRALTDTLYWAAVTRPQKPAEGCDTAGSVTVPDV